MAELLTLIATLAIVMVGIAIMLQITSVEEILGFIWRALVVFVLILVVFCILKSLWRGVMIPWLSASFEFLKTLTFWLIVIIIGLIALSLVGRLVLKQLGRHLTLRRDPQTGDGYEIHDSKEEKD